MFVEVLDRIKDTLVFAKTALATDSIVLTIPDATPRAIQQYEDFVVAFGYRPLTFTQTPSPTGEYREKVTTITFPLDIFSQPITSTWDYTMMLNTLKVMDATTTAFNARPRLEDSNMKALKHIDPNTPVIFDAGEYSILPYPTGSNDYRHHFGVSVIVSYIWSCPGKQG